MNLSGIQSALRDQNLDGWLFYDHHHRDPIANRILGMNPDSLVTRRWYYFVPAQGEPKKLVHRIEAGRLDTLPGEKAVYSSWQELEVGIGTLLEGHTRLAMQYSPRNAIMYVSMVDAGTIELLREMGKTIVSSADLVSQFEAVLSEEQIASHYEAQRAIDEILAEAFRDIGRRLRATNGSSTTLNEYDIVSWLQEAMRRADLVWEHGTNVSVNANSADSHYEPSAAVSKPVMNGDFLLIDMWAKNNRPNTCFYDITWTGVIGREPSDREQQVFETVYTANAASPVRTWAFRARRVCWFAAAGQCCLTRRLG